MTFDMEFVLICWWNDSFITTIPWNCFFLSNLRNPPRRRVWSWLFWGTPCWACCCPNYLSRRWNWCDLIFNSIDREIHHVVVVDLNCFGDDHVAYVGFVLLTCQGGGIFFDIRFKPGFDRFWDNSKIIFVRMLSAVMIDFKCWFKNSIEWHSFHSSLYMKKKYIIRV